MSQFSAVLYRSPISNLLVNANPCPIQPRVYANGCADYVHGAWRAGLEAVFSSERFEYSGGTSRLPGYGLVNLHASHALNRDWSVFGRIGNLFDKDYELAKNYATEGRAVFVGVRHGFH